MDNDRINIINYYSRLVLQFGNNYKSLDWGSTDSQQLRFEVLSSIGNLDNKRILDVGCGLGDYYKWLRKNDYHISYHGIDITPGMIDLAADSCPDASFSKNDIFDDIFSANEFHYIVASGIFYLRRNNPYEYMQRFIYRAFEICIEGIAFNSLSSWNRDHDETEFYADPLKVIKICREVSNRIVFRHDYHPNDFTVFIYK